MKCMLGDPQLLASYTRLHKLGEGSYGSVFLVKVGNQEYALKEQLNDDFYSTAILNELNILRLLRGVPNIIQLHGVCTTLTDTFIFLQKADYSLSYWISHNNYYHRVAMLPTFLRQLVDAIYSLESLNIIHFDLKPSNILMNGQTFLLTDFGSTTVAYRFMNIQMGTYLYQSPEILRQEKHTMINSDIWSLAMCALELCLGNNILYKDLQSYDKHNVLKWVDSLAANRGKFPASEMLIMYDTQHQHSQQKIIADYSPIIDSMMAYNPIYRANLQKLMHDLNIPEHPIAIQSYHYPTSFNIPLSISGYFINMDDQIREQTILKKPSMAIYRGQLSQRFPIYSLINLWQFIIRYTDIIDYTTIVAFGLAALYMSIIKDTIRLNEDTGNYQKAIYTVYYIVYIYFNLKHFRYYPYNDAQLTEREFHNFADSILRMVEYRIYNPHLGAALQQSVSKKDVYLRYYTFMSPYITDWFVEDINVVLDRARLYYIDLRIPAIYPGYIQQLYSDSWKTQITTYDRQQLVYVINELSPEIRIVVYAVKLMDYYFWKNVVIPSDITTIMCKAFYTAFKTLNVMPFSVDNFIEYVEQKSERRIFPTLFNNISMDMLIFGTAYDVYQWDHYDQDTVQYDKAMITLAQCMYLTDVIPLSREELSNICYEISTGINLSPLALRIQANINRLNDKYKIDPSNVSHEITPEITLSPVALHMRK